MMRPSIFIALVFVFGLIVTVFTMEQNAQMLRNELIETNRQLKSDLDELHVLKAEWVYLTQPRRLQKIARQYLKTDTITVSQVQDIENLPLKPLMLADTHENGTYKK